MNKKNNNDIKGLIKTADTNPIIDIIEDTNNKVIKVCEVLKPISFRR